MAILTAAANRAARALLNWTTADLAKAAGMSATTINKIERGDEVREASTAKIVETFAQHGVEVLNGDAPGARLKVGRLTLHERFGEAVEALAKSQDAPHDAAAICAAILRDVRTSQDLLPGVLARILADLDDSDPPSTYGEGAERLAALLSAK